MMTEKNKLRPLVHLALRSTFFVPGPSHKTPRVEFNKDIVVSSVMMYEDNIFYSMWNMKDIAKVELPG
jgi:hypothetical protein